jgi:4-hydroxybutyrate dehydrogenase
MQAQDINFDIFGVRVAFGWHILKTLGKQAVDLRTKKALIVTDRGVDSLGIPEMAADVLKAENVDSVIYKDVSPNPTDLDVQQAAKVFREKSCDLIIGLGGGSPMDAAKGVRVLVAHPEPLHKYFGLDGMSKIINKMPPLIEITTTSGTGAETSTGAIIIDTGRKVKCLLVSGMPTLALVDPALTVGMSANLTAATGMDALSHNIEALLSPKYHPVAEAIAIKGIWLVANNLVAAVEEGKNRQARSQMAMASSMGALAFQKGLGVCHSLSHQVSSEYGVHHGLANAILMPHAMEFNLETAREKMTCIAFAMGEMAPSPEAAIKAVAQLNKKIGLPTTLSEVGVSEKGIPRMAQNAMDDWCHRNNPRTCTEEDMKKLLVKAM